MAHFAVKNGKIAARSAKPSLDSPRDKHGADADNCARRASIVILYSDLRREIVFIREILILN